jgi:hypothetical protein
VIADVVAGILIGGLAGGTAGWVWLQARRRPHEHEWSPPRVRLVHARRDGRDVVALCKCQDCLTCPETIAVEALEPWRPA